MILLSGCATPEPIIQYETVTVYRDRYIKPPAGLTKPCELVELPAVVDTLALGAAFKAQAIRMKACNAQLQELAKLGTDDE